ncbi:hypothetical protein HCUR_00759 [Holospora curviuscula]|uniref:Uncharacterized protein n=1 Tax=Holospora curviuscula TaxID=1082868 RepID=A0A2S5R8U5_9PROT|nr:hypothetical protein HCUR_00759 [Holospora curviuscula]
MIKASEHSIERIKVTKILMVLEKKYHTLNPEISVKK